MSKNKGYAAKKRSLGPNDTEKALHLLEDSFLDSNKYYKPEF